MSSSNSNKSNSGYDAGCYDSGKKAGSETPSISNSLNNAAVAVGCGIIGQGEQYAQGHQDGEAQRENKNQ
jgi:hypothetical protein